jgi:hypothetical protein
MAQFLGSSRSMWTAHVVWLTIDALRHAVFVALLAHMLPVSYRTYVPRHYQLHVYISAGVSAQKIGGTEGSGAEPDDIWRPQVSKRGIGTCVAQSSEHGVITRPGEGLMSAPRCCAPRGKFFCYVWRASERLYVAERLLFA